MTSLRTVFSRGASRALGILVLSLLASTSVHAQSAPAQPAAAAPAPTGAPPAPAETTAAPGAASADQGAYTVRLRGLEKNVNELKEQIFRTKARLNLLKETVLGGVIGASRAIIHHKNEMGSSFRLVKAAFALDGDRKS